MAEDNPHTYDAREFVCRELNGVPNLEQPSLFWRSASHQTILSVAALSRGFLFAFNKVQVHGLPRFLELLKSRADYRDRRKGLLTVSNHISVLDDPIIWGTIPLSFTALHLYNNHRFSFGSHDICFKASMRSLFFTLGQTLPTHRLAHSPFGGPFQATMTEGVRLFAEITTNWPSCNTFNDADGHRPSTFPRDCVDPFSDLPRGYAPSYPSYTNDVRHYHAPSRYACNSNSWIHIFPEGQVHQSPTYNMRYFKWGFTRLILEPPVCPDIVPIFITGTDQIMHESRAFPRFLPRIGKTVGITFGEPVDGEALFGDLRKRWAELYFDHFVTKFRNAPAPMHPDAFESQFTLVSFLKYGEVDPELQKSPEAEALRIECARRVRDLVLAVRKERGYPDEDPKASYAQTWAIEGPKREGKMEDGTWVGDT